MASNKSKVKSSSSSPKKPGGGSSSAAAKKPGGADSPTGVGGITKGGIKNWLRDAIESFAATLKREIYYSAMVHKQVSGAGYNKTFRDEFERDYLNSAPFRKVEAGDTYHQKDFSARPRIKKVSVEEVQKPTKQTGSGGKQQPKKK